MWPPPENANGPCRGAAAVSVVRNDRVVSIDEEDKSARPSKQAFQGAP
jgi:hypothetical protein